MPLGRSNRSCLKGCGQITRSKSGFCRGCDSTLWLSVEERREYLSEIRQFLDSVNSLSKLLGMTYLIRDLRNWNILNRKSLSHADLSVLRHDLLIQLDNQK